MGGAIVLLIKLIQRAYIHKIEIPTSRQSVDTGKFFYTATANKITLLVFYDILEMFTLRCLEMY